MITEFIDVLSVAAAGVGLNEYFWCLLTGRFEN
jgi:hypothetical protein